MEVIDVNAGALAASLSLPRCGYLFVCTPETSHVGTNRAHIVLNSSPQENAHLTIYTKTRRAARRDSMSRLHVGLPPTKLLLRLTEQLLAQQIFPVETTFPTTRVTGN